MEFLKNNYTWIFSGAGCVLLAWIAKVIFKGRENGIKQQVKGSKNVVQVGRDYYSGTNNDKTDCK